MPLSSSSHKIGLAIVCLHISAVLYILVGVYFLMVSPGLGEEFSIGVLIFCLGLVAGIEFVVYGLHRRSFWAWVAGLCIFGVYLPSFFLPLGALGLWGLLDAGSRGEFGIGR